MVSPGDRPVYDPDDAQPDRDDPPQQDLQGVCPGVHQVQLADNQQRPAA